MVSPAFTIAAAPRPAARAKLLKSFDYAALTRVLLAPAIRASVPATTRALLSSCPGVRHEAFRELSDCWCRVAVRDVGRHRHTDRIRRLPGRRGRKSTERITRFRLRRCDHRPRRSYDVRSRFVQRSHREHDGSPHSLLHGCAWSRKRRCRDGRTHVPRISAWRDGRHLRDDVRHAGCGNLESRVRHGARGRGGGRGVLFCGRDGRDRAISTSTRPSSPAAKSGDSLRSPSRHRSHSWGSRSRVSASLAARAGAEGVGLRLQRGAGARAWGAEFGLRPRLGGRAAAGARSARRRSFRPCAWA